MAIATAYVIKEVSTSNDLRGVFVKERSGHQHRGTHEVKKQIWIEFRIEYLVDVTVGPGWRHSLCVLP